MSALGAHGASAMIVSIGFTPDRRALRGAGAQRGGESLQSGFGDAVPEPLRADVPFAAIARDRIDGLLPHECADNARRSTKTLRLALTCN
jgi:hypothetical protein